MTNRLASRLWGKYVRVTSSHLNKRLLCLNGLGPIASFTFDDFPRSALNVGGVILNRFDARGTYFASMGLMGSTAPTGVMFEREDLSHALRQGHEIGCHTYDHYHAGNTAPRLFEDSVARNQRTFSALFPGHSLQTLAYPIYEPRPGVKRRMQSHYVCCRGGGQTYNDKLADLNSLRSFFIEQSRDDPQKIYSIIDSARQARGWLIFSTHDVDPNPTPWGCTPEFFEDVVRRVVASRIRILPIIDAWKALSCSTQ
jgi:peptidoglycan/xylan/chitin deacetylase (PgdA/CDA1 family)